MIVFTIIISAIIAGLVAILVTLAIEKFGGLIGGVLGTIPSTIIPAAAGVYLIDGEEGLLSSMSIVPLGMLVNGLFLGVWILLPRYISNFKNPLLTTTICSILTWATFAFIALKLADISQSNDMSPAILGIIGLFCLIVVSIFFNLKTRPSPKGDNKVPLLILSIRGTAAAIAIGVALILARNRSTIDSRISKCISGYFLNQYGGFMDFARNYCTSRSSSANDAWRS